MFEGMNDRFTCQNLDRTLTVAQNNGINYIQSCRRPAISTFSMSTAGIWPTFMAVRNRTSRTRSGMCIGAADTSAFTSISGIWRAAWAP